MEGGKKDNSRKISIFYLQKLMAMSSYMVNSKYVDPKFPPCEEYSQNNYIPEQGSDYYSQSQDTEFQHPGIYPRSNYTEQPFSCTTVPDPAVQPRAHVHDRANHPSHFAAQTDQGPPVQAAGPRTCGQQQSTKTQNGIQAKQPAVVYPWMKKVHVTTVNPDYTGSEPKRSRTAYTRQQVLELEKEFHFNRSTKAAEAGSSRGHISAARTDPSTPDPPDRQHFLSQALLALVWKTVVLLKNLNPIQSKESLNSTFYTCLSCIYIRRNPRGGSVCAFVSSCQMNSCFVLYICTVFYLVWCFEMCKVYWKNKDF
uniref:Homeobox D4a n=1 Tax=Oryzias latipes TaxID=8090 RepID=A0A3P9LGZ0_ORYLA